MSKNGENRNRKGCSFGGALLAVVSLVVQGFAQCQSDVDPSTLAFPTIYGNFQMRPGQTLQLGLVKVMCCFDVVPADVCVAWSVDDTSQADIDPVTGFLAVAQTASPGRIVTVTANVEDGRRIMTIPVYVFSAATHPLVGVWTEAARFSCTTGNAITKDPPIEELVFRADGTMYVTRIPFEIYVDYWALYHFDLEKKKLSFSIEHANATPLNVDGVGKFEIREDGGLLLKKLSLGRFSKAEKKACRYEFTRMRGEF